MGRGRRDFVPLTLPLPKVAGLAASPRLRRLRLHHLEKLVLGGLLGVRVAKASEYQHGVSSLRHSDAIWGTVGAGNVNFMEFLFQFVLLSWRFPWKPPLYVAN